MFLNFTQMQNLVDVHNEILNNFPCQRNGYNVCIALHCSNNSSKEKFKKVNIEYTLQQHYIETFSFDCVIVVTEIV